MHRLEKLIISSIVAVVLLAVGDRLATAEDVAKAVEIPLDAKHVPIEGQPMSAVVVSQCSKLVAVYLTMPDGRLLRFDRTSGLPVTVVLEMADTAKRKERIEVACDQVQT